VGIVDAIYSVASGRREEHLIPPDVACAPAHGGRRWKKNRLSGRANRGLDRTAHRYRRRVPAHLRRGGRPSGGSAHPARNRAQGRVSDRPGFSGARGTCSCCRDPA
jgi:hypothetical protein